MKPENLDYLGKQLQYLGFGDQLKEPLQKAMATTPDNFTLPITLHYGDTGKTTEAGYALHFKKGNEDMYFLNSYDVQSGGRQAHFYVNNGAKNITSKEAFNLLEGRSVYKEMTNREGEKCHAWLKINPETSTPEQTRMHVFNDNYGYDISAALDKVNNRQLYFSYNKEAVIQTLQKGNLAAVHNLDKSEKYFVAAEPQFKTIALFTEQGQKVLPEQANKQMDNKSAHKGISL